MGWRCASSLVGLTGLFFLSLAPTALAAPGPGAEASERTYVVTAYRPSRGADYTGRFVFMGDPARPQRLEVGAWQFVLLDARNTAAPEVAGVGTWVSVQFFWLDLWLALGNTGGGGNLAVYGIAWNAEFFGAAHLLSDPGLRAGRYRMFGHVAVPLPEEPPMQPPEQPPEEEMTEEEMPEEQEPETVE